MGVAYQANSAVVLRIGRAIAARIGIHLDPVETLDWDRTMAEPPICTEEDTSSSSQSVPGWEAGLAGVAAACNNDRKSALAYFIEAAQAKELDLSILPGFNELTVQQKSIVVDAYDHTGRYCDAAKLFSRII